MRHQVDGRKFGRNTSHRVAMFRVMANQLIANEKVITTVPKAKELRRVVDRLITLGKRGTLHAKRIAFDRTRDRDTVSKLFGSLSERYAKRAGGYCRVLHTDGTRWGDAASMALIELVDRPMLERKKRDKKAQGGDEKAQPTQAAAGKDDHEHDHEHGHHPGHHHEERRSKGKLSSALGIFSRGGKATNVRKTPTQSGGSSGGRSGGSS